MQPIIKYDSTNKNQVSKIRPPIPKEVAAALGQLNLSMVSNSSI